MVEPEISPQELRFRFQLAKQLPATINIFNPGTEPMGFKVKTTTPKKYCVRPSSGTIKPQSTATISVLMQQAQKEIPADFTNCKDKFLVQTVILKPDEEPTPETFKKEVRPDVKEAKLKVILEGPAAPPSPVPEATQEEEEAGGPRAEPKAVEATRALPAAVNPVAPSSELAAKYEALRMQLDRTIRERDELKKKLDVVELQKVGAPAPVAVKAAPSSFRLPLIQLILVAIIAFLAGHYLQQHPDFLKSILKQ